MIVLAVDIAEEGSEFTQNGGGDRTRGEEGAGFAVGLDLAFDEEFVFLDFEAVAVEKLAKFRGGGSLEDGAHPRAVGSGTDGVGRGAAAVQEGQSIDEDGLAGAGFAGEEIKPAAKADADAFDDGVVFDDQLEEQGTILTDVGGAGRVRGNST